MDETTARARFAAMIAADKHPVLQTAAVDDLIQRARVVDESGRWPADPGYDATWTMRSLHRMAAEAWRQKIALVANGYDFSADGAHFSRSQLMDQLERQEERYIRLAGEGSGTVCMTTQAPAVAAIFNG